MKFINIALLVLLLAALAGCAPAAAPPATGALQVLAVETFLADIAQNVAGDRAQVTALLPLELDPHAFEPTPQDVARIAASQVLIVNGSGLEGWMDKLLKNTSGQRLLIEASAGLTTREPKPGEIAHADEQHGPGDPHFWLDPLSVVRYVENIRDGLIQADPAGKDAYTQNAAAYIAQLQELDGWIRAQVEQVPPARRQLITNHESFGYYADRYGFSVSGTILTSVSSSASPSARQLVELIERIRQSGAPAIFLETGASPQLANQIASETGIKVVTGLYTHSITAPGGKAPSYIAMIKANTTMIVEALK